MTNEYLTFTPIFYQSDSRSFKWLANHLRRLFIIILNPSNLIYQILLNYPYHSIFLIYTIFNLPLLQPISEFLVNEYISRFKISRMSTRNHIYICFTFFILSFAISILCIDVSPITSVICFFNTKQEYFIKTSLIHFFIFVILFRTLFWQ